MLHLALVPRRAVLALAFLVVLAAAPVHAQPTMDVEARQAIVLDHATGMVLFEKDADQPVGPSSMSKLMTLYLLFDSLKSGAIQLDTRFRVSEKAWRKGGSKMWVEVGELVRVEDLIRGITVQSGNDACVVVAEALAGTEENFAALMNEKAVEIGLTGSNFVNATGWPDPDHYMTVRDIATLARRIHTEFPDQFGYFSEKVFVYQDISQNNRNPLLYRNVGADGMKTGHTEAAGYGLAATAKRGDRRVFVVLNGMESKRQRAEESERLVQWAFREFRNYALFQAGETVMRADVWLGDRSFVDLVLPQDFAVTLPRGARKDLRVSVRYDEPIPAPIEAGQEIATLHVASSRLAAPITAPLLAREAVRQVTGFSKLVRAAEYMVFGSTR